jgi:hypothetical protein
MGDVVPPPHPQVVGLLVRQLGKPKELAVEIVDPSDSVTIHVSPDLLMRGAP